MVSFPPVSPARPYIPAQYWVRSTNHLAPRYAISPQTHNIYIYIYIYIGRFIMFSVIPNTYNKKIKGPILMELFTATEQLIFWGDNYRCSMCAARVTQHTSIRYSTSCHTRVNMGASIFFTAAMIRALGHRGHLAMVGRILCTKCTLHSNHRLTRVIFQHTKRLFPRSGHFLTTYTRIA